MKRWENKVERAAQRLVKMGNMRIECNSWILTEQGMRRHQRTVLRALVKELISLTKLPGCPNMDWFIGQINVVNAKISELDSQLPDKND